MAPSRRRATNGNRDSDSEAEAGPPRNQGTSHRRRQTQQSSASPSPSPSQNSDDPNTSTQDNSIALQTKLLVRLALSSEHARTPLRRTDINKAAGTTPSTFKLVWDRAQLALRETFGVELVELPSREKVTLRERLATQTAKASAATNNNATTKAWVLCSALPQELRSVLAACDAGVSGAAGGARAIGPAGPHEAAYVGLYTFVVSLLYLSGGRLADTKLERFLRAVNADASTPVDSSTPRLLERMRREGYIEKKVDTSSGESVVEYFVGPRGKVEVGEAGVGALVREVYGEEEGGEEREDLEKRIECSLKLGRPVEALNGAEGAGADGGTAKGNGRGKRPRAQADSDDD